jgi:hypothetical protein
MKPQLQAERIGFTANKARTGMRKDLHGDIRQWVFKPDKSFCAGAEMERGIYSAVIEQTYSRMIPHSGVLPAGMKPPPPPPVGYLQIAKAGGRA